MASLTVSMPEQFSFIAVEWENWIKRFQRFRLVSGLSTSEEAVQVSTLIYCMGPKAEDVFASLGLSTEEQKVYSKVVDKITSYFIPKVNVIYERARFHQRVQQNGEEVESFVTDLHKLAEKCSFGTFKEESIRDRIVVGILNKNLSERLQMDSGLTLSSVTEKVIQSEQVHSQQSTVQGMAQRNVSLVKSDVKQKQQTKNRFQSSQRRPPEKKQPCYRCGYTQHLTTDSRCPAIDVVCNKCGKNGHFQRCCKSGDRVKVSENRHKTSSNKSIGVLFLGSVSKTGFNSKWTAKIVIGSDKLGRGQEILFTLDSGADVSCIPESVFKPSMGQLCDVSIQATGAGGHSLNIVGKFNSSLTYNDRTINSDVYVIKGLKRPLLGRDEIEKLKLLQRISEVSCETKWKKSYSHLFDGLGTISGDYHLSLVSDAEPYAVSVPRRVALPLLPKVQSALENMQNMNIIEPVTQPTDWCAPMVVVPKPNGEVRITTDFSKLNKFVRRERFELPSVEATLAKLGGAKIFSKLDANSGFYQVVLDRSSSLLTTFITPFGRYMYKRLPMGISSAPELFSRKMDSILSGLEGVLCLMDDICIFGATENEHDLRVKNVLERLSSAGLTLNPDKCVFGVKSLKYLGFIVDSEGVHPDPDKVSAIREYPDPKSVTDVRRWMGMINQLAKFIPNLADKTKPLRELLCKNVSWTWDTPQREAFESLKSLLTSVDILAHYDPLLQTRVSADSSSYGCGAILWQKHAELWRPVAYASKTLSSAETRYATIEKEALAITWACEKFSQFLIGLKFEILTDHSPLVSLLDIKRIDELPIRIQRFRIRLLRFSYNVRYLPGKLNHCADALSRAPIQSDSDTTELYSVVSEYVCGYLQGFPASENRLQEISKKQSEDPILSKVISFCQGEWPTKTKIPLECKAYLSLQNELSVVNNLLMKGSRIVIPSNMIPEMLVRLHEGHMGIVKCLARARSSVWWPGITVRIKDFLSRCEACCKNSSNRSEPLITSQFPTRPWQVVASDFFYCNGRNYLLVIDYYSRFVEIILLSSMMSVRVIEALKSIFARHGIPEVFFSDGGTQYTSFQFRQFAKEYGFVCKTSSPEYAQSNGEAERAVQTMKKTLIRCISSGQDPYLALLAYRTTPLSNGFSPSQLLMGRTLRSTLPQPLSALLPFVPNPHVIKNKELQYKAKMKKNADRHRGARPLPPLSVGQKVFVKKGEREGIVVSRHCAPRSYMIKSENGQTLRRNRKHLHSLPQECSIKFGKAPSKVGIPSHQAEAPGPQPRRSQRSTKGNPPVRYCASQCV